ncbi:MAG: response regulator transcription factor [Bacteroidia bacterium]|nr:response regulator transcription factor [Bacteroidia bacterium]
MLHAIVVDDEQKGINSLKLLLEKKVNDVKIVASSCNPEEGIKLIDDYRPDIVFLDINMPLMNGFGLLKKITFTNFHLIFTTAHEEYALQAIKNNALDYLLKPIDTDDLTLAIQRVRDLQNSKQNPPDVAQLLKGFEQESNRRIAVPYKDGMVYVNASEIVRLEADSNYTRIFFEDGKVSLVPKTLKDFETALCQGIHSKKFMRVHQSHIINLQHVTRFTREEGGLIRMKDNEEIPLSKTKKEEFITWLGV